MYSSKVMYIVVRVLISFFLQGQETHSDSGIGDMFFWK